MIKKQDFKAMSGEMSLLLPDVIGRGTLINIYVKTSILKQSSCERDV